MENQYPKTEKCTCPIELKPLEEWVQEDDPENCRECMLAPVTQWYRTELQESGRNDLVKAIDRTVLEEKAEPLQICRVLDKIKTEVEDSLRERLKDFDCAAQTFNPDDALDD